MAKKFGYFKNLGEVTTTRSRSGKQEGRIAKQMKGRTTINSGATFGQNDVVNDFCEVEAKTTEKKSFSLSLEDWYKASKKCNPAKFPVMVVDFEKDKKSLAIIDYNDLLNLLELANEDA